LVVGPSGAGKDSILRYAMLRFAGDDRFTFPRRCITREVDATAEDHESLDEQAFDAEAALGAFALMWEAHGLKYGVRNDINTDLEVGRVVVVNVSRTIINEAGRLYRNAVIAEISADPLVRAARLAARGREGSDGILLRTQRQVVASAHSLQVRVIKNDGNISYAGEEFCGLLMGLWS
jgi:ribose 1,5-bisphosphokinase